MFSHFSILKAPKEVTNEIEKLARNIFWNGAVPVVLETPCEWKASVPLLYGGLGIGAFQ